MRLLAGLPGPRKGLIGPWSHAFPNQVVPGPAIGYLQEALRFWDHWLKGIDTGVMDEPMLRVWMEDFVAPAALIAEHPGRWVAEEQWPSPRIEGRAWALNDGTLDEAPAAEARLTHSGLQLTGMDAGAWCAEGTPGDWPARPARRGRPLADLHLGAAGRAARDHGVSRGHAAARRRQAGRPGLRAPVRRRTRRLLQARHPPACST